MRDRLTKIVKESLVKNIDYTHRLAENITDDLLTNGVIAPPCKVGQTVYFHKAELDEICPAKVIEIRNNYYTPSIPLWITIEYESKLIGRQKERMASEVFVMLCKPTAEEAEKALERREG